MLLDVRCRPQVKSVGLRHAVINDSDEKGVVGALVEFRGEEITLEVSLPIGLVPELMRACQEFSALHTVKSSPPMAMSSGGIEFLIRLEGCVSKAYRDVGAKWTIGVGHLLTASEQSSGKIPIGTELVHYSTGLSSQQTRDLLSQDVARFEKAVCELVKASLKQHQFDALVSFVFNIGEEAFENSTLLKVLNKGEYDKVPVQMRRWIHDNGKVIEGLRNRREKEIRLWEGKDV